MTTTIPTPETIDFSKLSLQTLKDITAATNGIVFPDTREGYAAKLEFKRSKGHAIKFPFYGPFEDDKQRLEQWMDNLCNELAN